MRITIPHQLSSFGRGILVSNGAVVLFGLAGVLGKISALPAPLIVLARVVFGSLALGCFWFLLVLRGQPVAIKPLGRRDLVLMIGQGVLLAIHWTLFFASIEVANVAIGLLAFSSFPLFTAWLEPLLLHLRVNRLQLASALFILPGIYLLVPAFSLSNTTTLGILLGLGAGATFALLSVINRGLSKRYNSLVLSLYQDGIAALVLLPTLFFWSPAALFTPHKLIILLILGVGCTALAHTLFIVGMRDITAQLASLFGSLEPIWGIVFACLLLQEWPDKRTLLGGAIILVAVFCPVLLQWWNISRIKVGKDEKEE